MKYSNYIGVILSCALILCCFMPWVYIPSVPAMITGLKAEHTNFGRPGLMNVILSAIAVFLFIIPKIWAKRTNLFVCTFDFAWMIRNFLIITQCQMGECPQKKWGIYAAFLLSALLLLMALLPKISFEQAE